MAASPKRSLLGVDPSWLARRIDDPSLRVVDVRPERGAFGRGHVPGSVALDVRARLFDGAGALVSAPELALTMSAIGVGDGHTVILVDDPPAREALAAAWALGRYGHFAVHVLEGGFARWQAEGHAVSRTVVRHPAASFTARVS